MRPSLGTAKKDFLIFVRDRASLFWVLAFPIIMMLLFSTMFGGEGAMFDVACVDNDGGQMASVLVDALNSTEVISLHIIEDEAEAFRMVEAGEEDLVALLVIPSGFTSSLTSGLTGNLEFYVSEEDPEVQQMLMPFISGFVEEFNSQLRREVLEWMLESLPENLSFSGYPMTREELSDRMMSFARPINVTMGLVSKPEVPLGTEAYWENSGKWVSTMFVYSFLFSGMVGSSWMLVGEKENKTLKRLRISPASTWSLLMGKVLSALIALSFSQIVLVATTMLWLRPEVNWSPALLLLVVMGDLTGISLGLLIAEISPSPRAAGQAATAIGVMLQFIIGVYFPLQLLPGPLRTFSKLLPFTRAAEALDGVLLRGAGLSQVIRPSTYLGASSILLTALAVALFPRWASEE